jgi:putative Holliday junction resolvase
MKRMLGLDVGDRTIGIAVSDELGITAQAVGVYQRVSWTADLTHLQQLLKQYKAAAMVVGLPKNMNGSLGPQAQKTLSFIARLRQSCAVPVIPWDERLTTQQAERLLLAADASRRRRKHVRDQLAAQLILQTYLEWQTRHAAGSASEAHFVPQNTRRGAQNDEMREPDADQQRD